MTAFEISLRKYDPGHGRNGPSAKTSTVRTFHMRSPEPLRVPVDIDKCWSADFMSDSLWCGRKFGTFNLLDDYNREALGMEIDLD